MESAENNSEVPWSWTLINAQNEESSEGATPIVENNPSEESDGISVISESEMKIIAANNDSENDIDKASIVGESDSCDEYRSVTPLTPPLTPNPQRSIKEPFEKLNEDNEEHLNAREPCFVSRNLLITAAFAIIVSILYAKINGLSSEIQTINVKIAQLEQENQQLKMTIDNLQHKNILVPEDDMIPNDISVPRSTTFSDEIEGNLPKPKTKTVWLGNDREDKVEILDKKSGSLPDYCYFTDENDLFYEYNQEICGKKRRKLEAKNSRDKKTAGLRNDESPDNNALKIESEKTYDEIVSETLRSLTDEIQEIKRKRVNPEKTESVVKDDHISDELKSIDEKPEKSKKNPRTEDRRGKKRLFKQRETNTGEWVDKRTNGREEARKSHEKVQQQDTINWYLKRKNEREIHRLEAIGQSV